MILSDSLLNIQIKSRLIHLVVFQRMVKATRILVSPVL